MSGGAGAPAPEAALAGLARTILLAAAAGLAAATVLFHGASLAGVPFGVQAPLGALLAVGSAAAVLRRGLRGLGPGLRAERREGILLAALCGATGLLLLAAQHATSDDSTYLPPVTRCLAHPDRVPGSLDFLWIDGPLPRQPRWALPVPFDLVEGSVSFLTGIPLPWVRYVVGPFFLASLVPAAWFLLISRCGFRAGPALAGTFLGGATLLLLREAEAAPGCVLVLRVYQAKFFAPSVLFPLFAAGAMDWVRAPSRGRWLALLAVATASAGCSLSSILLQILLAALLALAAAAAEPGAWRRCLGILPAAAYPAAVALWIHGDAREALAPSSPINAGTDPSFRAHFLQVFGGPWTPVLTLAGTSAATALLRGAPRRFLAAWTGAVFLLLFNPWVAPTVVEHVTSSDIYWRVAYLLPFPLLLGAAGAAWADRGATRHAALAGAALLALQVPAQLLGAFDRPPIVHPLPDPDRCFNRLVAADARWVAATAPPGPVLAPQYLSTILVVVDADHPVVVHWPGALRLLLGWAGQAGEADLRHRAWQALQRGGGRHREALRELLRRHPGLRTIVLDPGALDPRGLEAILEGEGFRPRATAPSGLRLYGR